jgi:hypothetical protein
MSKLLGVIVLSLLFFLGCMEGSREAEPEPILDESAGAATSVIGGDAATLFGLTNGTLATCTAQCGAGAPVSCSSTPSCEGAWDRNCAAGERGHARCNGINYYCAAACQCVEGELRYIEGTGCCCNYDDPEHPVARRTLRIEACVNGSWVGRGSVCDGQNCGGICPLRAD